MAKFVPPRSERQDYEETKQPRDRPDTGGCSKQLVISIFGAPTGGTLEIPVTITTTGEEPTEVEQTVSFAPTATAATIKSAFISAFASTAAEIGSDQIEVTIPVGTLPNGDAVVKFKKGLSLSRIAIGEIENNGQSNMTGGVHVPYARVRICCA